MKTRHEKNRYTLADYHYHLPKELIAQHPAGERTGSRLLHLSRETGECSHLMFTGLPGLLRKGDLLVVNDTKVFPARLMAARSSGGSIEIFLLEYPGGRDEVPCFVKPARKIKENEVLTLDDGQRIKVVRGRDGFGVRALDGDLASILEDQGYVPLPPYITRKTRVNEEEDRKRYQTVFADRTGAVAAPTAGLHFDDEFVKKIKGRGVGLEALTLHVGPGTFQPVRTADIRHHEMMSEWYEVPEMTAAAIQNTRQTGGRVIAVGTTVVRALESAFSDGRVKAGPGDTDMFIYPGYEFKSVDGLVTNFHLPESTLLMLVCAFAGWEKVMAAYGEAVDEGYRFYSYGDAMVIT